MEFLAVFAITLCMLVGLCLALIFGRAPTYRPQRREILELMGEVIAGCASVDRWNLFLALPIAHDPELEQIRRDCLALEDGMGECPPAHPGINGDIYDRSGLQRLHKIRESLKQLVEKEPVSRWF